MVPLMFFGELSFLFVFYFTFLIVTTEWELFASGGERPEILVNMLQCTIVNYLAQQVYSIQVVKLVIVFLNPPSALIFAIALLGRKDLQYLREKSVPDE